MVESEVMQVFGPGKLKDIGIWYCWNTEKYIFQKNMVNEKPIKTENLELNLINLPKKNETSKLLNIVVQI